MKVTVDANILFSAMLKKGEIRRIWFNPQIELYAPRYLLIEFQKYQKFLKKKFAGTTEEFLLLFQKMVSQIYLIQDKELKPFLSASAFLSNDPKDWSYLACALKEETIIWSNDKEFKKQ
ncbi:PIN domain-containing protein, partial [Candidatus Micrarchaeota archaeon]|nr:PIN domain-containing protein [Candidatus Micrarchaeota archaeon]MBU1931058.1 PIN domain-containing protein [Candidatus Micrarchaeota archaeon]